MWLSSTLKYPGPVKMLAIPGVKIIPSSAIDLGGPNGLTGPNSPPLPQIAPLITPGARRDIVNDPFVAPPARLSDLDELIAWIRHTIEEKETTLIFDPVNLLQTLVEFNEFFDLKTVKSEITRHILCLISNQQTYWFKMPHTILTGSSYRNKRMVAKYLARIWAHLGQIGETKLKILQRYNFSAPYIGRSGDKVLNTLRKYELRAVMIEESSFLNGDHPIDQEILDAVTVYMDENASPVMILDHMPQSPLHRRFMWTFCVDN
jgi:hypothetical protein